MSEAAARSAIPSIADAAGRGMEVVGEAARREPKVVARSFATVSIVAILALFVWASWLAPWAKPGGQDAAAGVSSDPRLRPLTRGDLDDSTRAIKAEIHDVSVRVDRLYERLPAAGSGDR